MAWVKVTINGNHVVKVKRPKKLTKKAYADGIAEAVRQTCEVMDPSPAQFHMALGVHHG